MKSIILLALYATLGAYAVADCNVSIKQTLGSSWQQEGKSFSQWNVQMTAGSETVNSLELALIGRDFSQFWELSRQGSTANAFNVAFNYGALQAGATQGAGIVVRLAGSSSAAMPAVTLGSLGCQ